jgi:hypothetical protein
MLELVKQFYDLKHRKTHPAGKFDKAKRFTLAEHFDCCKSIRRPSRRFPFSEMVHGRTLVHFAHKHNLDEQAVKTIRKLVSIADKSNWAEVEAAYLAMKSSTTKTFRKEVVL